MPSYTYDPRLHRNTGGYRNAKGQVVSKAAVRDSLFTYIDAGDARGITKQLQEGKIAIREWQSTMREIIKDGHLNAIALERGGYANMTQADYGRAGGIVKGQYAKLDNWANQLADGTAPFDGRMLARADLYTDAVYSTYAASDKRAAELSPEISEMRNKLDSAAAHCDGCLEAAALGWVDVEDNDMTPIGKRDCLSRCRCTYEYR